MANTGRAPNAGTAAPRALRDWPYPSWSSPGRCGLRRCAPTASVAPPRPGSTSPGRATTRSRVPDPSAVAAPAPAEASVYRLRRIVPPASPPARHRPSAEPLNSCRRYAIAASAAASTAATPSPISSKASDTAANSAASPSRTASANLAASPTRGPSTILQLTQPRRARPSPNCTAVCRHITSAANRPLAAALSAADFKMAIASLTAPWPAVTHARATLFS